MAAARRLAQHLRGQALSIPISAPATGAAPATAATTAAAAAAPTPAAAPPTAALSVSTPGYEMAPIGGSSGALNVNTNNALAAETGEIPPLDASTPMEVSRVDTSGVGFVYVGGFVCFPWYLPHYHFPIVHIHTSSHHRSSPPRPPATFVNINL